MPTPPTFVSATTTANWTSTTTPLTVSQTVSAGDYLAIFAGAGDGSSWSLPTGGGLTYTLQQSTTSGSGCAIWTATSASSQSFTLSIGRTSGTDFWGFTSLRFSGASGVGASGVAATTNAAPAVTFTTQASNSAVACAVFDFNDADGSSRTWRTINGITPTAGNGLELIYSHGNSHYTIYVGYWSDAGAAGSITAGLTAPSTMWPSTEAVEIKGSSSSAAGFPPREISQYTGFF